MTERSSICRAEISEEYTSMGLFQQSLSNNIAHNILERTLAYLNEQHECSFNINSMVPKIINHLELPKPALKRLPSTSGPSNSKTITSPASSIGSKRKLSTRSKECKSIIEKWSNDNQSFSHCQWVVAKERPCNAKIEKYGFCSKHLDLKTVKSALDAYIQSNGSSFNKENDTVVKDKASDTPIINFKETDQDDVGEMTSDYELAPDVKLAAIDFTGDDDCIYRIRDHGKLREISKQEREKLIERKIL